jgi:pyruvate formate lyase activating enzyme
MTSWIAERLGFNVPLHFTAFHPDWKMQHKQRTPLSTLRRARRIAMKSGLRYVYIGNVHDVDGSSTRCRTCDELLIGRDGYDITGWSLHLKGGHAVCRKCRTPLPGLFENRPGDWGSRRQVVYP